MTAALFPYPRTTKNVTDVICGAIFDFEKVKSNYDRRHSKEATVFLSQYLHVEKQLHETFSYISPTDKNKETYSIVFASIIKSSASLFELISRYAYTELYICPLSELKKIKIKHFLSLSAHAKYATVKLSSFYFHDTFTSQEIYEPFHALKTWDEASALQDMHIPKWWNANNKLKHSNDGLPDYGTLENAIASVGAVFTALHTIYGQGLVWGIDINSLNQHRESPKSIIFSPI